MENIQFDAAQEALQHYRKHGYNFSFTKATIADEDPKNWQIEAVHSFTDTNNAMRSQIVYALRSKVTDQKGIILRRIGTLAVPFKALFLQKVEQYNPTAAN